MIGDADYVYDADDWDVSYTPRDIDILFCVLTVGDTMEVGRLRQLPSIYVLCVEDEDGERAFKYFASEEEVLKARRLHFGPLPTE